MVKTKADISAIDPLYLLLGEELYIRLTLPDPPPVETLAGRLAPVIATLGEDERKALRMRANGMARYTAAIEKALGG